MQFHIALQSLKKIHLTIEAEKKVKTPLQSVNHPLVLEKRYFIKFYISQNTTIEIGLSIIEFEK